MVGLPVGYTQLVEGVDHHTKCGWIPKSWLGKFAPPSKFQESDVRPSETIKTTLCQNASNGVHSFWMPTPTCLTKMSSWNPHGGPWLMQGPSILGREGQSTSAWWTPPFGNEHTWIKAAYEKIHNLQWWQCFWGPSAQVTWSRGQGGHPA